MKLAGGIATGKITYEAATSSGRHVGLGQRHTNQGGWLILRPVARPP
jgi:hypothetical protein